MSATVTVYDGAGMSEFKQRKASHDVTYEITPCGALLIKDVVHSSVGSHYYERMAFAPGKWNQVRRDIECPT